MLPLKVVDSLFLSPDFRYLQLAFHTTHYTALPFYLFFYKQFDMFVVDEKSSVYV